MPANPTRTEMIEAVRLPDEHSEHTFGALISYLISQAFDRVETLNREATHRYYTQCKLCGGTDELREHYKTSTLLVKHDSACSLAAHLERLRTIAAHPAILRELEAGGWRIDGQTLVGAARELVRQIANNDFRDSHGHDAANLRAYAVLQRFVSVPSPPATSDGGEDG